MDFITKQAIESPSPGYPKNMDGGKECYTTPERPRFRRLGRRVVGMTRSRPGAAALRELVIDELSGTFVVHGVDQSGFLLECQEKLIRVDIAADQMDVYTLGIEDSAFDVIGIEPRWRSSLSLVAVHILEEVAIAELGQRVIIDGLVIRRDPPT